MSSQFADTHGCGREPCDEAQDRGRRVHKLQAMAIHKADDSEQHACASATAERPALTIDRELYEKYLEDSDLSDAEKREFIETLWSIMVAFVDLGFGLHPLQQACEQQRDFGEFVANTAPDMLGSTDHNQQETADGTATSPEPSERRPD